MLAVSAYVATSVTLCPRVPLQLTSYLRDRVENSVQYKPRTGVRGVGMLGICASKVLFSLLRCPWPQVEAAVRDQVRAKGVRTDLYGRPRRLENVPYAMGGKGSKGAKR